MPGPAPLGARNFGNQKGVNVQDGTANTDVANVGQVATARTGAVADAQAYTDNPLAGLASGQTLKGTVRAYTATNVNITAPGSTIDGLTPQAGAVFLLGGQTTGSQGGPQVWNGAAVAMPRPANWDSQAEAVLGSYWIVREGTSADSFILLANDSFTLGTTTPVAKIVGIAQAAVVDGYREASPAVVAGGTWTVTHNLGMAVPQAYTWATAPPGT